VPPNHGIAAKKARDLSKVQGTQPCIASFSLWVDFPGPYSEYTRDWDYFDIEISSDSGKTWVWADQYNVATPQQVWIALEQALKYTGSISLNSYIGKTVQIRIAMCTDEKDDGGEGVYVDNFIITGKTQEPLPGPNTVLLVDNDGSAVDIRNESWTKYMEASLANLGYRYSLATIGYNKSMPAGYLEQFPLVIWNLGANYDGRAGASYFALTPYDQENIKSYLNNGGKLWTTAGSAPPATPVPGWPAIPSETDYTTACCTIPSMAAARSGQPPVMATA